MKLFVFSWPGAVDPRDGAESGALTDAPRAPRGRFSRGFSLFDWVLVLAGIVVVAGLLPVIDVSPILQYPAYGALFGGVLSREVIVRRERRRGELPPEQVKHLERVWIWGGIAVMTLALAVQVLLDVLRTL